MKKNTFRLTTFLLSFLICFSITSITTPKTQAATFDKTKAKKNISVTYKKLSDGVLAIYKNKNNYAVKLTGKLSFCDADKKNLETLKEINYCLGAKSDYAIFYPAPLDDNGNIIRYSSYKGSFSVAKTKYKSYSKKLTASSDIQTIFTNFSVVNTSGKKLENIHATIVFYDGNGKILGCQGKYLNCYAKNSIDMFTLNHNQKWGQPAKIKIYINWAY